MIKFIRLATFDATLFEPKVFGGQCCFFFQTFIHAEFEVAIGRPVNLLKDNHSPSVINVLRRLHYQIHKLQGKLVLRVLGSVFYVALDKLHRYPTFGQYAAVEMSAENQRMLGIPEGFVHGLVWNDLAIGIQWLIQGEPTSSAKDQQTKVLAEAEHFG